MELADEIGPTQGMLAFYGGQPQYPPTPYMLHAWRCDVSSPLAKFFHEWESIIVM
jgi:hypothetical protein